MTRQLLVLRHGEAKNGSGVEDYDRALASRGYAETELISKWLLSQGCIPKLIFGSSAERTSATAFHAAGIFEMVENQVAVDQSLYLAPKTVLLDFIAGLPHEAHSVMLVGHNPGLEDLVSSVVGYDSFANAGGHMATATIACIEFEGDWPEIMPALPILKFLRRPIDVV